MDDCISRREHEEFVKRMDEANERASKRLSILEDTVKQINALASSVERLAVNMENMAKEQARQRCELEEIKGRDGEMWRKVLSYAATAIVGALVSYVLLHIGL